MSGPDEFDKELQALVSGAQGKPVAHLASLIAPAEQTVTLRVYARDGATPVACRICGRFYNWIIETDARGQAVAFICDHGAHETGTIREVGSFSVGDHWCEVAHRFRLFDHDGAAIRCDICGGTERWVLENINPEGMQFGKRYVCEHPAAREHFRVFRLIRPVPVELVLFFEKAPLVRD